MWVITLTRKMLLIINPKSGKKTIASKVCDLADLFIKNDYEITLHISQDIGDIYRIVKKASNYDSIVCSGGDGSLNEMVHAILEIGYTNPVGYIPSGTTNDFAKTLNLSMDPITCAKNIVEGGYICCDIGSLNDMSFAYIAAFGALSDVSYSTPQSSKNILGHSAYVLEGIKQLLDLKKYTLKIIHHDVVIEDEFCFGMITNSISVGGMQLFKKKDVDLSDGLFECVFIKYPDSVQSYQQIIQALITNDYTNCSSIYYFKTSKLSVSSEEMISWTVDGEFGGEYKDVEIYNHEKALKIFK